MYAVIRLVNILYFGWIVLAQEANSPPFYPSPVIRGSGDWFASYVKAREFVANLTIPEKVNLTTGTGMCQRLCHHVTAYRMAIAKMCRKYGIDRPTRIQATMLTGCSVGRTDD